MRSSSRLRDHLNFLFQLLDPVELLLAVLFGGYVVAMAFAEDVGVLGLFRRWLPRALRAGFLLRGERDWEG